VLKKNACEENPSDEKRETVVERDRAELIVARALADSVRIIDRRNASYNDATHQPAGTAILDAYNAFSCVMARIRRGSSQ